MIDLPISKQLQRKGLMKQQMRFHSLRCTSLLLVNFHESLTEKWCQRVNSVVWMQSLVHPCRFYVITSMKLMWTCHYVFLLVPVQNQFVTLFPYDCGIHVTHLSKCHSCHLKTWCYHALSELFESVFSFIIAFSLCLHLLIWSMYVLWKIKWLLHYGYRICTWFFLI